MSPSPRTDNSERPVDRRTALKLGGGVMIGLGVSTATPARGGSRFSSLSWEEYSKYDGLGLADLVKRREVTATELLELAMVRTEAVNGKINAIVLKLYDQAREAIRQGLPQGPFTGVPFLVKDLDFRMRGVVSTEGSRLYADNVADADDTVVQRYRQAGLVIFGRTHSPELGGLPTTESALHGITRNPWNLERTAGGSSGGTAAAVAAGIVPMGSASDGGGSIRIPASCCGLFGLKPTRARVPWGPKIFEVWEGLAVPHAITRSVRDSAALLDASCGPELGDAYCAPAREQSYLEALKTPPVQLRVGVASSVGRKVPVHPDCREAVDKAAALCESLGHHIDDVTEKLARTIPSAALNAAFNVIVVAWTAVYVEHQLAELGRDLQEGDVEPITRLLVEAGRQPTARDLIKARLTIHDGSRAMARFLKDYDVILTPTLAKPPIEHGILSLSRADVDGFVADLGAFMPFTPLANWTGQPAMSVPLHWTSDDLPVGVQFLGRFGEEGTLFRLARQLEEAQPWSYTRPLL
jgi:amidase/6-aminohexanoate-cyclic-dimer hydrolase